MNRGVEKRKIFLDDRDYFRFRDDLHDFNTIKRVVFSHYDRKNYHLVVRLPGEELVDILAVCLMPNHFHLLVQEKVDGGAGLFSRKFGGGYTRCFNERYKREGVLFQGRSKKILVEDDEHFVHLPYYIFSNPLKLIFPEWKDYGVSDVKKAMGFLDDYKWGSFRELFSDKNNIFSSVVNKKLFLELFGFSNGKEFRKYFIDWLKEYEG